MFSKFIERVIVKVIVFITNFLPVKTIRDDRGVPFLYRYHLVSLTNDGPGLCIHRFVRSDPDRGYHDHPWNHGLSFILSGGYQERILDLTNRKEFYTVQRNRWTFNYIDGKDIFHRVMLDEGTDSWSIFFFGKRRKTWGMIGLDGEYRPMSRTISDQDGGWWNQAKTGYSVENHLDHPGKVIATVDIIVLLNDSILLIKRGKNPYKDCWAFPGGRIESTDTDIRLAAVRELKEETHLDVSVESLDYLTTIGNNTRDPRGFCLTNVFVVRCSEIPDKIRGFVLDNIKADDDAVDYQWFSLDNLPAMAFDHKEILDSLT